MHILSILGIKVDPNTKQLLAENNEHAEWEVRTVSAFVYGGYNTYGITPVKSSSVFYPGSRWERGAIEYDSNGKPAFTGGYIDLEVLLATDLTVMVDGYNGKEPLGKAIPEEFFQQMRDYQAAGCTHIQWSTGT